jgi:hypothetical protein
LEYLKMTAQRLTWATDMISLHDAARITGIHRATIVAGFRSGALPRTYVNGKMKVSLRDVSEWYTRGGRGGR